MVACVVFKSGHYLKAFSFDPNTFFISNQLYIKLPKVLVGTVNYTVLLNPFDAWLKTHCVNNTLYYDGPKFGGADHFYINGRRIDINDLNIDAKAYVGIIYNNQVTANIELAYRDTHIKTVREAVNTGKPALECLLLSDDTNEVRMAFAMLRDHYHARTGKINKPSYTDTLNSIHGEIQLARITEFVILMLPTSQRKRIGLVTLKKASKSWRSPKGLYVKAKEDLRNTNIQLFNIFEQIAQRAA